MFVVYHPTVLTWMLVLKLGEVIDILINDDVEVVGLVVRCHVGSGECLRHHEAKCMLVVKP
jgi:hypothetical protein